MTAVAGAALGPLSLGAANAGNLYREMTDDEAHALFDAAWDGGIRYYDTAPHYGLGLSERRLGRFLAGKPRDEFQLSTKVGRLVRPAPGASGMDDAGFVVPATSTRVLDYTAAGVRTSLEESLERLGLDRVDILYVHDPEAFGTEAALETALPALAELRDAGVVSRIGIGSMDPAALLAAAGSGLIDLVMCAGRYTLLEQPALDDLVPLCRERGIGIVNTAVFNSGLLANPEPRADSHYDNGGVPADKLERARRLAAVCAEHGVELPAAALQYTLRDPAVETVLVGASNAHQVVSNLDRVHAPIPQQLWRQLAAEGLIP